MEQLTQKEVLEQLNSQTVVAMQSSDVLQTDILESEEIQDTIKNDYWIAPYRIQL